MRLSWRNIFTISKWFFLQAAVKGTNWGGVSECKSWCMLGSWVRHLLLLSLRYEGRSASVSLNWYDLVHKLCTGDSAGRARVREMDVSVSTSETYSFVILCGCEFSKNTTRRKRRTMALISTLGSFHRNSSTWDRSLSIASLNGVAWMNVRWVYFHSTATMNLLLLFGSVFMACEKVSIPMGMHSEKDSYSLIDVHFLVGG